MSLIVNDLISHICILQKREGFVVLQTRKFNNKLKGVGQAKYLECRLSVNCCFFIAIGLLIIRPYFDKSLVARLSSISGVSQLYLTQYFQSLWGVFDKRSGPLKQAQRDAESCQKWLIISTKSFFRTRKRFQYCHEKSRQCFHKFNCILRNNLMNESAGK